MMEMECAGCGGGAPPRYLINYIHLYTFMCFHVPATNKWWNWRMREVVEVRPLGICSFMYFIVGGCILCAGDVCKWVCIEMCEGWRGALCGISLILKNNDDLSLSICADAYGDYESPANRESFKRKSKSNHYHRILHDERSRNIFFYYFYPK